jgi:hypothetical protein
MEIKQPGPGSAAHRFALRCARDTDAVSNFWPDFQDEGRERRDFVILFAAPAN